MEFLWLIDILGVVAFSISGVLTAMKKRLDVFGVLIIGFVTSVGGGTLRDVLIGFPVAWMRDLTYVYVVFATTAFAIIFRNKLNYLRTSFFMFDTIGIGLYTVVGVEKGIAAGLPVVICVAVGTISACFGGVIRDILCNEIPVIFRKEIYATACILGGFSYFLLIKLNFSENWTFIIAGLIVIVVRGLAVIFKLTLPSLYKQNEDSIQ